MQQTPVVLGRMKPVLQEKSKVDKCNRCKSEFGFFSIKYHCMACGFIFCKTCADVCILLPGNYGASFLFALHEITKIPHLNYLTLELV
jgi:late competence protein required for DNA uptake (superfamily II DNA/RNA helicase)